MTIPRKVIPNRELTYAEASDLLVETTKERDQLRKALAFIAADRKLTVDHLRGYADGVLQGLAAAAEGREAGNDHE